MNQLKCHQCNSDELDAFIQYGSYMLRCKQCGTLCVTTSYIAIGYNDTLYCYVYEAKKIRFPWIQKSEKLLFPWDRNNERLFAEGIGKDIYEKVSNKASDGTWLRIEWKKPNVLS